MVALILRCFCKAKASKGEGGLFGMGPASPFEASASLRHLEA